ncbi:MAG TPA: glucoamylase family protein [Parafilimonas sp.]|nr:glucoamylase family protein [Parafilimonas sp.]
MKFAYTTLIIFLFFSCSKKDNSNPEPPVQPQPKPFSATSITINGQIYSSVLYNVNFNPVIKTSFASPLDESSVSNSVSIKDNTNASVSFITSFEKNDSILVIKPTLSALTKNILTVSTTLKSKDGGSLKTAVTATLVSQIDSTDKFNRISDSALLTLVQQQTFKYFWDFGHPTSGMARERNSSGNVCTTGGTGFGIMSMIVAANRNFISRTDALNRIQKIVSFYKNKCTAYHGAYTHWIDGSTGATVPFSTQDDGADLVETSYLMQGLLCARQYFNSSNADETKLRDDMNSLWNAVDWKLFQQNGQNVLYWHWSPNYQWAINQKISGWNEALIVYVLAASSNTNAITKNVYDNGWARNGAEQNGNTYYGIKLPLGPNLGGPLFFAHYSFLGINPHQLSDAYANYWTQDTAHTKINYHYCVDDPNHYFGYSNVCWGLTASDEENGYSAHAPDNDNGTITPTAAISSLPYSPTESMNALKFFYYTLGDKLWGDYGFVDAFNLNNLWFADSYLAIDQGPEIVMIENYRTGLLWNLFMSCPEIKSGMKTLGFSSPYL